ncbi:MAG: lipopolysaccharide heptosyltransferase II [Woeseiaceae bacterium]|nr:lipopolysaccharide heptosyltransferase II [Woeseiaceae bacterium]
MSNAATLIVGPSWVGDMVMAQSLFKLLKEREPERPIDVLAPGWSLPVVARMPEIREGIAAETGHGELGLAKRRAIAKSIRGEHDRAIILPRSLKSALIPWLARIPSRTGFRGESRFGLINDMRPFDKAVLDQTVKRYVALGVEAEEEMPTAPLPALGIDANKQQGAIRRLGLDVSRPVVAFMPGAEYGPAKCWPHEQFAALARLLEQDGFAVWVLGSEKDRPAGDAIAADSNAVNICGKTSLEDVIDLLAATTQAVSNDSGLMHIASAVGTHVHGVYGSSSPHFTPPLTPKHDIHWLGLECSPCFKRECPLGHLNCLKQISPERLHEAILRVAAGK